MTSLDATPKPISGVTGSPEVVVVDLGSGNIGSILNMFRRLGVEAKSTNDPDLVRAAPRIVLPGVGAFDGVMSRLNDSGLIPVLEQRVLGDRVPMLGICVGLQLLGRGSEEGILPGLGWFDADVRRLPSRHGDELLRIPHMGWSPTRVLKPSAHLATLATGDRYYFVHSFALTCDRLTDVLAVARYGEEFVAAVEVDNVIGVQFHPEKSHRHGLAVLRDFAQTEAG